eukprot:TRINITY_DN59_c0_g1_i2.p1 TRINITY_DN59_c0_g1~~TRINITY_DN59_c0_g1_i2.p1  ORF type:complete len:455 (-),score=65.73 TRINITY_DN59_c0_g1_i2:86-1450(-)
MAKWSSIGVKGPIIPVERHGHTVCAYENKMILFGGTPDGSSGLNDVYIYDPDLNQWSMPEVKGTLPHGRYRHSALVVKNRMYIFGGYRGKCLDDLNVLDLLTMTWTQPEVKGTPPSARSSHSTVAYGSSLVLFGGSGHKYSNEVFKFDTDTYTWHKEAACGTAPSERWCHTAYALGKNMYVFGGSNDKRKDNHVYILNMETMTWTMPNTAGPSPSPRQLHSVCGVGECMFIFGGWVLHQELNDLHVFNTRTNTWSRPNMDGKAPSFRQLHSSCTINGCMAVFGGYSKYKRMNDIHFFTPEKTFCSLRERCIETLVQHHTATTPHLHLLAEELAEDYFKRLGQVGKLSLDQLSIFLQHAGLVTELSLAVAADQVTNEWLYTVGSCGHLTGTLLKLDLVGCKHITEAGLACLRSLSSLKLVVLDHECKVAQEELARLHTQIPGTLFMKALPVLEAR